MKFCPILIWQNKRQKKSTLENVLFFCLFYALLLILVFSFGTVDKFLNSNFVNLGLQLIAEELH